jgi:hypothetical protein
MHFDFKGIMEGAFNSVFVNKQIEKIAEERTTICRDCPHDSINARKADPNFKSNNPFEHCGLCGCNIHMKTRSLAQVCPDKPPRWDKVIEIQEEWILDQKLDEAKKNK